MVLKIVGDAGKYRSDLVMNASEYQELSKRTLNGVVSEVSEQQLGVINCLLGLIGE